MTTYCIILQILSLDKSLCSPCRCKQASRYKRKMHAVIPAWSIVTSLRNKLFLTSLFFVSSAFPVLICTLFFTLTQHLVYFPLLSPFSFLLLLLCYTLKSCCCWWHHVVEVAMTHSYQHLFTRTFDVIYHSSLSLCFFSHDCLIFFVLSFLTFTYVLLFLQPPLVHTNTSPALSLCPSLLTSLQLSVWHHKVLLYVLSGLLFLSLNMAVSHCSVGKAKSRWDSVKQCHLPTHPAKRELPCSMGVVCLHPWEPVSLTTCVCSRCVHVCVWSGLCVCVCADVYNPTAPWCAIFWNGGVAAQWVC